MLHLMMAADEVKLRQSEIAKDYDAYRLPKAVQSAHSKTGKGIVSRIAHLVTLISF